MFFLATPHRGADSAQLLDNILRLSITHNLKAYVGDLIPNSAGIQVINDEFRHAYSGIQLWSFFETVATSMGLIVTKDSAVLGLPGERVQLLNADHRHVCKFEDPSDNNYCTIRNAFVSTIDSIEKTWLSARKDEHRAQMRLLSRYLAVSDKPEAELSSVMDKKVEGSCEWLTDSEPFLQWIQGSGTTPRFFWLSGAPATGKSTIAGHVVRYLDECNSDCMYFFFKDGDTMKSTISEMLRSVAWQMAWANMNIRQELLSMESEGYFIDKADPRSIWRTIFAARICQVELRQPCYWVLDALDESSNYNVIFPLLAKIDQSFLLRVFLTSRPSLLIERLFSQEKIPNFAERITKESSQEDIRIFLEANSSSFPVDEDLEREELIHQILEKSNGNFLWTSLVLKELEITHSKEHIREVLKAVPEEMDGLYTRILQNLTAVPKNMELARAILKWTIYAARPLSVKELKMALTLDINETLPRLEKIAGSLCGYLIYIDNNLRVQVAHQTVRAFLFQGNNLSKFTFDRQREHHRLSEVCLQYLRSEEMTTSRYRRGSATFRSTNKSAFADYAIAHFSYHLARSTSSDDHQLVALNSFLQTNSLTWIELIARGQDLNPLIQTAKNLKAYLERRAKYASPTSKEFQNISAWSRDLIQLVARFGKVLLTSPYAIHFLVPPVCPPESIIARTFSAYYRPLQMVGLSEKDWNDQLCCVGSSETQALSIACQDNRFAVGASDGIVRVYHAATFQEEKTLTHGEPVRKLEFGSINTHLASAGRTKIGLWNSASGTLLRTLNIVDPIITLDFTMDNSQVVVTTRANSLKFWRVADGFEIDTCQFADVDEEQGEESTYLRPPTHAAFSAELNLLVVAYRQRPVNIWDLEENTFVGHFYKSATQYPHPLIFALIFNSNPVLCLAAVAYDDGDVITFDPWTQKKHMSVNANAATLASSPDGTILATGNGVGVISLYDFESLSMLYQISSYEQSIRSIVFSSNNLRFFDIRGGYCNAWEPSVLVRRTDQGEASSIDVSEEVPSGPQRGNTKAYDDDQAITAMTAHHEGEAIFCGREDGSIAVYSTSTGREVKELFSHAKNVAVFLIGWSRAGSLLVSVDRSGRFLVQQVANVGSQMTIMGPPILDKKVSGAIVQILLSPNGKRLVISTPQSDQLWNLEDKTLQHTRPVDAPRTSWKWVPHPSDPQKVLLFKDAHMQILEWTSFKEVSLPGDIKFNFEITFSQFFPSARGNCLCIVDAGSRTSGIEPKLRLLATRAISQEAKIAAQTLNYDKLAKHIKSVIGRYDSSLVFLTHNGWICSLNIDDPNEPQASYVKHFFIPFRFHSTNGDLLMLITINGSVVVAYGDELVVFHSGLGFEEEVELEVELEKRMKSPPPSKRLALKRASSSATRVLGI